MHIIAAKAVAFWEAMQPEFVVYQERVLENARVLAAELGRQGLRILTGGTDNHLVLADLTPAGVTGRQVEEALESVGIIVNRNSIPFDSRPPQITSGIRLGTPAVTTRGFGVGEIRRIAGLIIKVLSHLGEDKVYQEVRGEVREMCRSFPLP